MVAVPDCPSMSLHLAATDAEYVPPFHTSAEPPVPVIICTVVAVVSPELVLPVRRFFTSHE
jgi:hypothetical protein